MQSLALALKGWSGKGRPIEIPFRQLAELVTFRTGQIAVLAGAAGSGKTTLAANWAWRSHDPILYLAQEDPFETMKIFVALATQSKKDDVRASDVVHWSKRVTDLREELVIQTGAQSVQALESFIVALTEWLGAAPPLIIIDSLFDLKVESDTSYMDTGYYAEVLPGLKDLTLKYDVGMVLQHHVNRGHGLGTDPLRMTDLLFGGEKEAAHVWGVYHAENSRQLFVQVLKQRSGSADPNGVLHNITLDWQPEMGVLLSR